MMIIDKVNPKLVAVRDEAIATIKETIKGHEVLLRRPDLDPSTKLDVQRSLHDLRTNLRTLELIPVVPETVYVPGSLPPHQAHAVEDTKWTYDGKPEPERTYSKGFTLGLYAFVCIMSIAAGIGFAVDGQPYASIGGFGFVLLSLLALASESKSIKASYHNRRIARVDVGAIEQYPVESRLTGGLRLKLGDKMWNRLIKGLRAGDPELDEIFGKFCKGATWFMEKRDQADKIYDVNPTGDNNCLLMTTIAEANVFTETAAAKISMMFEFRDAEQLMIQQAFEEAAIQAAAVRAEEQLLDSARESGVLKAELDWNKPTI